MDPSRAFIKDAKRVIIKVGTAVVTRNDGCLALGRLGAICEQVKDLMSDGKEVVFVTSGAVGVGRQKLRHQRMMNSSLLDLQKPERDLDGKACAAVGRSGLVALYDSLFSQLDVASSQLLATDNDFRVPEFRQQLSETVNSLLALRVVPIFIENDAVSTSGIPNQDATGTFWNNASLAVLLALEIRADLLILLSDVEGLCTGPPTEPTSQLIHTYLKEKHDDDMVTFGAKSRVGRGGLTAKVYSAWHAASAGIPVVISSVCAADGLQRVMRGELIGTLFHKDAHLWVDQKETGARDMAVKREVVKTAERVTTCAHSCAHHAKLMDVALWSGLPEEVQELVFSRLPWPDIFGVRFLSKGWDQKLMSGSQFKQACARAQPKSFALLVRGDGPGSINVNMFDTASNRWHTFETSPGYDPECGEIQAVSASDGGLVCFLSKLQSKSMKIPRLVFVCNPLTRAWKQLPPLYGIVQQKIMVQLIMDCETKHYRVIIVGYCERPKVGNLVKVYHSETGQWTTADGSSSGEVVYGYLHNVNEQLGFNSSWFKPAPCYYNFADGLVHEIITSFPGIYDYDSVLVKDRLFCLQDVGSAGGLLTRCIEEYEAVNGGASWILLKKYPLNRLPHGMTWKMTFHACKDFLLLFVYSIFGGENRFQFLWLYELSVKEWRKLPIMPAAFDFFHAQKQMCELCFDSVP